MSIQNDNSPTQRTTADYEAFWLNEQTRLWISLPNYLTNPLSKGGNEEDITNSIFEDENEIGGGCDSDKDCNKANEQAMANLTTVADTPLDNANDLELNINYNFFLVEKI